MVELVVRVVPTNSYGIHEPLVRELVVRVARFDRGDDESVRIGSIGSN